MGPLAERAHGRGTGPHFVIERFRRGGVGRIALGAHVPVTTDLDVGDLAELAFFDDAVASLNQVWSAPALGANLDDAVVLPRRGEHGLALRNIDTDWLLHP